MPTAPLLLDQLAAHGPWLLFVLAVLETCFVTGLAVPSGLATSAATIVVLENESAIWPVLLAAIVGGFIGDTLGFWIGRRWGRQVLQGGSGRWSRRIEERRRSLDELFGRHPIYSVTGARLISFVRTVMPMAAGMSGLSYRSFVPYEVVGVVGWAAIYVSIGFAGREGWEAATRIVGVTGAVGFAVATAVAWHLVRRGRRRRSARGPH